MTHSFSTKHMIVPSSAYKPRMVPKTTKKFPATNRIRRQVASALYFEHAKLSGFISNPESILMSVDRVMAVGDQIYTSRSATSLDDTVDVHPGLRVARRQIPIKWKVRRGASAAHAFHTFMHLWEDYQTRAPVEIAAEAGQTRVHVNYSSASEPFHIPIAKIDAERLTKTGGVPYLAKTAQMMWEMHAINLEPEGVIKEAAGSLDSTRYELMTPSFGETQKGVRSVVLPHSIIAELISLFNTVEAGDSVASTDLGYDVAHRVTDRPKSRIIVKRDKLV